MKSFFQKLFIIIVCLLCCSSCSMAKIAVKKGITNGRNSMSAVYRSGLTKLRNGTALRMSSKVIGKGSIAGIVGGVPMDIYYGLKQAVYTTIRDFILGW